MNDQCGDVQLRQPFAHIDIGKTVKETSRILGRCRLPLEFIEPVDFGGGRFRKEAVREDLPICWIILAPAVPDQRHRRGPRLRFGCVRKMTPARRIAAEQNKLAELFPGGGRHIRC